MELKAENEITEVTFDFEGAHLALCHKTQGFSANNKPMPLLVKSEEFDLSEDAKVAITQAVEKVMGDQNEVQVTTSLFDFLRKWYNLYWEDADSLSRILGYSGDGYEASEYLEESIGGVKLLKSKEIPDLAKASDEDVLALAEFMKSHVEKFEDFEKNSLSEGNPDVKTDLDKTDQKPSEDKLKQTQGDLMSTDVEKLEKAQADIEALLTKMADFEKAAVEAQAEKEVMQSKVKEFEKAEQTRVQNAFNRKVETYSFVTPEDKVTFAKTLIELDSEAVVLMLDKAQAAINALDEPQGSDDAQGIELKKTSSLFEKLKSEFGDGK